MNEPGRAHLPDQNRPGQQSQDRTGQDKSNSRQAARQASHTQANSHAMIPRLVTHTPPSAPVSACLTFNPLFSVLAPSVQPLNFPKERKRCALLCSANLVTCRFSVCSSSSLRLAFSCILSVNIARSKPASSSLTSFS